MKTSRGSVTLILAVACILGGGGGVAAPAVAAPKPVPQVVVDTDASFDDIAALAYLGEAHKDGLIELRAVTVSSSGVGLRGHGRANVECLLYTKLGLTPEVVPVTDDDPPPEGPEAPNKFPADVQVFNDGDVHHALDAARGPACPHADDDPAPFYLDEVPGVDDSVALLQRSIGSSPRAVTLIVLGAHTAVQYALADPSVRARVGHLIAMGGSTVGGNLFPADETIGFDGSQEFNFWLDPPAIEHVIQLMEGPKTGKMSVVPLDATNHVPLSEEFRLRLDGDHTTAAADVVQSLANRLSFGEAGPSFYWWDPLAAVAATFNGVVEFEDRPVRVVTTDENPDPDQSNVGELVIDARYGTEVRLGTSASATKFYDIFIAGLNSRLAERTSPPR